MGLRNNGTKYLSVYKQGLIKVSTITENQSKAKKKCCEDKVKRSRYKSSH